MKTYITDNRRDLQGQGCKITWRIWQVLADKSRMKRSRKTKIDRKVVYPMHNNAHQFQGQGHQAY